MPPRLVQTVLDNGLRVILQEVHTAPVVSTWLWYRVGSRNEVEGLTGISHWVEHMMFKGSGAFPRGEIMRAVDRCGGYVNAMTSHDFTAYYATLPAHRAELALRIEADRMTSALFDPDEVASERTVVIAEREGSENEPRYVLAEELAATAFRLHPYHHQTVGWKEDLQRITRDQLYAHYRGYYAPNNAVLVAVGDFDADAHLALIRAQFGAIAAVELPPDLTRPEPPQRGERRVTVRLPGSAPMVRAAYHVPAASHPDFLPLVIADAVLSGGKAMFAFGDSPSHSARLYRALVEGGLASSAGSSYSPSLDPYLMSVGATVRDGSGLDGVEDALLAEVERLQREPVTARELQVAIRQTQAQFAYHSESVTSRALSLGFLEMVDRCERMETVFDELAAVTPEDVLRVAGEYLTEDNRTVGRFDPTEDDAYGDDEDGEDAPPPAYWDIPRRGMCPYRGSDNVYGVLREELPNGITVLARENPASAAVTIRGEILPGGQHESDDTAGLAYLTAAMLRRGTTSRSFQQINQALDDVGASMGFGADEDDTSFGGRALAGDFDLMVDLLAEMLQSPAFPEDELERFRGQALTRLRILEADTCYRADRALVESLFPAGHPYARPILGSRATMSALGREQILDFYRSHYHPATMTIGVVGAVSPERVVARLTEVLGHWRPPIAPPGWSVPMVETPAEIVERRVALPAKSQVDLSWGVIALPRNAPDYYAAMMGNVILGQLGLMGRLGETVRDRQGLAYYVSSDLSVGMGPQPWTVDASMHPGHVAQAVDSILHEVARIREELVDPQELDDCRAYLTGALPLRLETNDGIAGHLLAVLRYGLGWDYLARYPDIIGAVTREEIRAAAARYLTLDRYVLSMAGTFAE